MATDSHLPQFYRRAFRLSLVTLPFSYYICWIALLGLFVNIVFLLSRFRKSALDPITRNGFFAISGLMLLSSALAYEKGEAFVQLVHFIPFFIFFSVLPYLMQGVDRLEKFATDLVLASIPINAIALVQYVLRSPFIPRRMRRIPFIDWVREAPHRGRAMAMFDHPNVLASYLVVIFGLGLGLILKNSLQNRLRKQAQQPLAPNQIQAFHPRIPSSLLVGATYFNLVGIFSSGSRNGLLIAVSQIVIFSFCVKASRAIWVTSIFSLFATLLGAALLGIGGRAISVVNWKDDPRLGVWHIALDLIRERPLLGWGMGNYKFLYPFRQIDPNYPNIFHPHNFWLLLASEAGILVMALLTLVVGYICYRAAKILVWGSIDLLDGAVLLSYCLGFWGVISFSLFDITFYDARINILNWVVLAGIYSFIIRTSSTAQGSTPQHSLPSY